MKLSFALFLFLFNFSAAFASPFLSIGKIDYSSDYPNVSFFVYVSGPPKETNGMTEENFSVYEDDFRVSYVNVRAIDSKEKLSVVLAVDCSKSIKPDQFLKNKETIGRSIDRLTQRANISLGRFNNNAIFDPMFSDNRDELLAKLQTFSRQGSFTLLYNCLYDSIDFLSKTQGSRKAVFIWTDGKDEGSSISEDDLALFSRQKEIPIIFISSLQSKNLSSMKRIAKISGGTVISQNSYDSVDGCLEYLDGVKKEYEFRYQTGIPRDGLEHLVEVRMKSGSLRDRVVFPVMKKKPDVSFPLSRFSILIVFLFLILIVLGLIFVAILVRTRHKNSFKEKISPFRDSQFLTEKPAEKEDFSGRTNREENPEVSSISIPAVPDVKIEIKKPPAEMNSLNSAFIHHAWFFVKDGNDKGKRFDVEHFETFVGSSKKNHIRLVDQNISENHFKIKYIEKDFIIYDLLSQKGTFLNGKKILRPRKLYDWDEIQLGTTVLIFRMIDRPEP